MIREELFMNIDDLIRNSFEKESIKLNQMQNKHADTLHYILSYSESREKNPLVRFKEVVSRILSYFPVKDLIVAAAFVLILVILPSVVSKSRYMQNVENPVNVDSNINIEQEDAQSIIEEFITEMYNVEDYKKIDMGSLNTIYPKDNYTNELRKIATEDALEPIIASRLQLGYISLCYELKVNSQVISKNISKYTSEEDGSIVYNYNGKVKLTFKDENKQKEENIEGQITVNKINNKWIITKFNNVGIENIAKYYRQTKEDAPKGITGAVVHSDVNTYKVKDESEISKLFPYKIEELGKEFNLTETNTEMDVFESAGKKTILVTTRYKRKDGGSVIVVQGNEIENDEGKVGLESLDKIKINDTDAWIAGGENEKGTKQIVFWRENKRFTIIGSQIGKNDLIKMVESLE
jgi:hypothetical protein